MMRPRSARLMRFACLAAFFALATAFVTPPPLLARPGSAPAVLDVDDPLDLAVPGFDPRTDVPPFKNFHTNVAPFHLSETAYCCYGMSVLTKLWATGHQPRSSPQSRCRLPMEVW